MIEDNIILMKIMKGRIHPSIIKIMLKTKEIYAKLLQGVFKTLLKILSQATLDMSGSWYNSLWHSCPWKMNYIHPTTKTKKLMFEKQCKSLIIVPGFYTTQISRDIIVPFQMKQTIFLRFLFLTTKLLDFTIYFPFFYVYNFFSILNIFYNFDVENCDTYLEVL